MLTFPPGKEAILPRQLDSFPRKLPALPLQSGPLPLPLPQHWLLLTFLLGKEAILPRQLHSFPQKLPALPLHPGPLPLHRQIAHLPPREGSNSPPAAAQLPPEATSSPSPPRHTTTTPAIAHLPPGEGSNSPSAAVQLPPGSYQLSLSPQVHYRNTGNCSPSSRGRKQFSPGSCTASPRKLPALPPGPPPQGKKTILPKPIPHPKQGIVSTPPGQTGRLLGNPPGINPLNLPRRHVQPPGKAPPPPHPPAGPAKVLLMKNLTLSGSLNLSNKPLTSAQRSVLAKGPNFAVTPQAAS